MSGRDDLVAGEGVDEGSAASTAEAEQPAAAPAASTGPQSAGTPPQTGGGAAGSGDVLGERPRGGPASGEQGAAPDDVETPDSRAAREKAPGQQYTVGEG